MIRRAWQRMFGGAFSTADGSTPERIIWIFGTARTGSTWLAAMMEELAGHARWHEPLVGHLFGNLYYVRAGHRSEDEHFILGKHRRVWLRGVRGFVLDGAAARFPGFARGGYLVIKEPNGSMGAPLLMEALPESRMILLVRDPRDVVASNLDAYREGSWTHDLVRKGGGQAAGTQAAGRPDDLVKSQANRYLRDVGNAKRAYDAHRGRKVLVKYEDLRYDTLRQMERIYSELGVPVDERQLRKAVERHAWENVRREKGEGKFHRKARPGGWREDLTPEQVEMVEEITGPLLAELYPAETG